MFEGNKGLEQHASYVPSGRVLNKACSFGIRNELFTTE